MNMDNFPGQHALINNRLKDVNDQIDTNQSLMLRLRSHTESMAHVLKSITFPEHFLNYLSYVNAVLCRYMNVMTENNCKLQMILNEELLKQNFSYNEYQNGVSYGTRPFNVIDSPSQMYSVEFVNNVDQPQVQNFGYFPAIVNVEPNQTFEYAAVGNYGFFNNMVQSGEPTQQRQYYTQYVDNNFLPVQNVTYLPVTNTNESHDVFVQDVPAPALNNFRSKSLSPNASPFVSYIQENVTVVQPLQPTSLAAIHVEHQGGGQGQQYYEVHQAVEQYFEQEQYYEEYQQIYMEQQQGQDYEHLQQEQAYEEKAEEQCYGASNEQLNKSQTSSTDNDSGTGNPTLSTAMLKLISAQNDEAKGIKNKSSVQYIARITSVKSPSRIFVRFKEEKCPHLQELESELNALKTDEDYMKPYFDINENTQNSNKLELQSFGNYGLYRSQSRNSFFRVKFLNTDIDVTDNYVSVFFLDFGMEEDVSLADIYPMPIEFKKYPRFGLKCHLTGVCSDDENSTMHWFSYEIEYLKNWACRNDTVVFIINDAEESDVSLPVFLYNAEKTECLNDLMTELRANRSEKNREMKEAVLKTWNPMMDAHESNMNTYELDTDDPACAIYGYVPRDYERICKHFSRTGQCFKGENCTKEHIRPNSSGYTTDREEIFLQAIQATKMPAAGEELQVEVTNIENACQFHCIVGLNSGQNVESLALLVDYMNSRENLYSMKKISIPPSIGQIVAAKYKADNLWYRAKVLDAVPENDQYRVFFVDYGNQEIVHISNLRMIPPGLLRFPFQAILCNIQGVVPRRGTVKEVMDILSQVCSSVVKIKVLSVLPDLMPHLLVRLFTLEDVDVVKILYERNLILSDEELMLGQSEMIPG